MECLHERTTYLLPRSILVATQKRRNSPRANTFLFTSLWVLQYSTIHRGTIFHHCSCSARGSTRIHLGTVIQTPKPVALRSMTLTQTLTELIELFPRFPSNDSLPRCILAYKVHRASLSKFVVCPRPNMKEGGWRPDRVNRRNHQHHTERDPSNDHSTKSPNKRPNLKSKSAPSMWTDRP